MSINEQKQHQAQKNISDQYLESMQKEFGATEKAIAGHQNDPYSIFQSINAQYGQTAKVVPATVMEPNPFENRKTIESDSSDASIPEEFKHFTSDIGKEEDYKEYIATNNSNHQQVQEPIPMVMRQHPRNGGEQHAVGS